MITRLRDGLEWRWRALKRRWFLLRTFRNEAELARGLRAHSPIERAVCRDGTVLRYPPGRSGLAETLLEIWHDQVYSGPFYRPRPGDVVIDAGANVGLFSIWLARREPSCRILAFEPFAENFACLVENLRAARASSVEPRRAALAAGSGFGRMLDGGPRSLDHRLEAGGPGGNPDAVPVYSFREVMKLAGAGEVALWKVDIEGSEADLFRGAEADDLHRVRRFAVEYHENIRPGVLELLREKLQATHRLDVRPEAEGRYGMLYATRITRSPNG